MTRHLLDTNIISNVTKPQPSESLLTWMAAQRDDELVIASLTVAEIRRASWKNQPAERGKCWMHGLKVLKDRKLYVPDGSCRSMTKLV